MPGKIAGTMAAVVFAFACHTALATDDYAARRSQIAEMPPAEQQELLRKQERFNELPRGEQNRLRSVQAAIDADPHSERLQQLLARYHEWLKTLTPTQRAELADLPPEERVQKIKGIQRQQQMAREQAHRVELLSAADMQAIVNWAEDLVWDRREKLVSGMSESQRKAFELANDQRRRRMLLYRALFLERGRRGKGSSTLGIDQSDLDRLSADLSEPARQELTEASDLQARRRIVTGWIGTAMRRLEPRYAGRRLGTLAGEELVQFLQNDVPEPQRERLLKLPREQMLEELRGMYFDRGRGDLLPGGDKPWLDRRGQPREGEFRGKGRPPIPPAKTDAPPAAATP